MVLTLSGAKFPSSVRELRSQCPVLWPKIGGADICVRIVVVRMLVTSDSVIPWAAACQASLSFTVSQSLIIHVCWVSDTSNHFILCQLLLLLPLIFPSIRVFSPMSQLFASVGQSIGASNAASVLSMNIQG